MANNTHCGATCCPLVRHTHALGLLVCEARSRAQPDCYEGESLAFGRSVRKDGGISATHAQACPRGAQI
eukprot:12601878-Alexandrium_andersonii.AAC.1